MVDAAFWQCVRSAAADPLTNHAKAIFEEATRCAWINGEPGFINGDALEDHRTGTAWDKPVHEDGSDFRSSRYQVDEAAGLLAELSAPSGFVALSGYHQPVRRDRAARHRRLLCDCRLRAAARLPGAAGRGCPRRDPRMMSPLCGTPASRTRFVSACAS